MVTINEQTLQNFLNHVFDESFINFKKFYEPNTYKFQVDDNFVYITVDENELIIDVNNLEDKLLFSKSIIIDLVPYWMFDGSLENYETCIDCKYFVKSRNPLDMNQGLGYCLKTGVKKVDVMYKYGCYAPSNIPWHLKFYDVIYDVVYEINPLNIPLVIAPDFYERFVYELSKEFVTLAHGNEKEIKDIILTVCKKVFEAGAIHGIKLDQLTTLLKDRVKTHLLRLIKTEFPPQLEDLRVSFYKEW